MTELHSLEIIIMLFAAVLTLTTVARKVFIPYPILLVIGGLALGLVPGVPRMALDPDLVFLVFLPPILSAAAFFTPLREFRANIRPISLLAVGLVVVTTAAVAAVAHAVLPGIGWAEALALGAIVSPPDAVSATAIAKRLRIPPRIVTILEGESLVNDATALVLYRVAVGVAVSGVFVPGEGVLIFIYAGTVGIAIGIGVAMLMRWALGATEESFTQIAITLLAPYLAWVLGELTYSSSVFACVATGMYLRRHPSEAVSPATRMKGRAVWDLLVFVLNGFIFMLIGLEVGALREAMPSGQFGSLVIAGAFVSATAILVRLVGVPLGAILIRLVSPSLRARDPLPPWSHTFIVAWTGMRGIVTLAAALALPLTTAAGAPFPFRAEIIMLSFSVILATLVLQGLSLAPLIRLLPLEEDRGDEQKERQAHEHAAATALKRLDDLAGRDWAVPEQIERIRLHYTHRLQRPEAQSGTVDAECTREATDPFGRLWLETLATERLALIALRNDGTINDELLHRLERELDVHAMRLGIGERRLNSEEAV